MPAGPPPRTTTRFECARTAHPRPLPEQLEVVHVNVGRLVGPQPGVEDLDAQGVHQDRLQIEAADGAQPPANGESGALDHPPRVGSGPGDHRGDLVASPPQRTSSPRRRRFPVSESSTVKGFASSPRTTERGSSSKADWISPMSARDETTGTPSRSPILIDAVLRLATLGHLAGDELGEDSGT